MSIDIGRRMHKLSAVLAEAAGVAGSAPSLHNTQPWRWRVDGATLELYAEPARQLTVNDPGGRLMVLSCGAALHHARIALAAHGWRVVVERLAGLDRPQLLARLTVTRETTPSPAAIRLMQTIPIRNTDRWPMMHDATIDQPRIDAIRAAVEAEHSSLHILRPGDLLALNAAAGRAEALEEFDPHWRQEVRHRAGGVLPDGLGAADFRDSQAQTTVPGRDFDRTGEPPLSLHDQSAVDTILLGSADTPAAWLYAGEALSAAWLIAIQVGVSVLPLSATVELDNTRRILRRLLSPMGEPFLVLRLGVADPHQPPTPLPPRLPSAQIIEFVGSGNVAVS